MGNEAPIHRPVMAREVARFLAAAGTKLLLDATVGAGGHSLAFLGSDPSTRIVGIDRDPAMVARARERLLAFGDRAILEVSPYSGLEAVFDARGLGCVDAALFDLGASSVHFDEPSRGFSFLAPGPLDMRYDPRGGPTAADLVNDTPVEDLAALLHELGDERDGGRIARAIAAERPIRDTLRLADVILRAVPRRGRIHPATRTFQALRIAVNGEFAEIERGLPAALRRLRPGGLLLAISFHSGEDRLVKRIFRSEPLAEPLPECPLGPEADEVRENPRARSARLRVARRREEAP
jgi:16S rRNA (cytosine1402-N4)-methyltransferase